MVLIDTHLHLSSPDYKEDIEAVISRAKTSNVKYFITIGSGYGADNFLSTIEISKKYNLFFALGVHPHDADMGLKIASPNSIYYEKTDEILQKIREASKNIRMVGIGEIGLDYYYEYSNKKIQRETFARFVDFSSSIDMPVIIHSRDAFSDTLDIIKSNRNGTKGVFHCFSYNLEMAKAVLDMGFYISIPGIVTFKKSTEMQG
ncbi:MAG: TatD family hydrolase, partial [Myxococcota bacterium]